MFRCDFLSPDLDQLTYTYSLLKSSLDNKVGIFVSSWSTVTQRTSYIISSWTVKFRLHCIIGFPEHRSFISNFIRLLHIRSLKSHQSVTHVNQHAIRSWSIASQNRLRGSQSCDWTVPRPAQGPAMSGGGASGGLTHREG